MQFGYSFLQNLIGGILTYTEIYDKLVEAGENEDYVSMAKTIGAIFYQLMSFKPIETSSNPIESFVQEQEAQQVQEKQHAQLKHQFQLMDADEFMHRIESEMEAKHSDRPLLRDDPTW